MSVYRVRLVFNGPVDREHPFCSVGKTSLEDALQIINDLPSVLVHTNSVQIHESDDGSNWRILSPSEWVKDSPLLERKS